jgi:hypothetical protein
MPLMLDEAWLRGHRSLVQALEADRLWPDPAVQQRIMAAQRAAGERLRDGVLFEVLGPDDFARLGSESIFGASNGRFRRRLPFVLAFGFELGQGLNALASHRRSERTEETGAVSAVFNLGVSIFDLLADTDPEGFDELSERFDASRLRGLRDASIDPGAIIPDDSAGLAPEVRILLKLIAAFFAALHALGPADDPGLRAIRDRVFASLLAAHAAELQSTGGAVTEDLVAVSEAKSTLPFAIIGDIARLGASGDEAGSEAVRSLVDHVRTVFWLTDDLADIVLDLQTGALNSLLARYGGVAHHQHDPARDYPVLARLLASREIEETAASIAAHLRAAVVLTRSATGSPRPGAGPRDDLGTLLACYVRDWIE